jgi:dihydrofolate synthase/folylpolyglutamate synthase
VDRGLTGYTQALDALFARTGATSRYGLERTLEFLGLLGSPHERIRTIHVAGTNGKGSVVAMLYALLRDKGLSVGRYTSPHLLDFRERIVVDEVMVSEDYILAFLNRWESAAVRTGATFFEITTAMAFHYFATRGVDVAIIETGLGGRLDATNVIRPLVAGITSIAIDHTEFLGFTEESIAREKAGIFKPGVPAVIGPMSREAYSAITRTAGEAGAPPVIEAHRLYRTAHVTVRPDGTRFSMSYDGESRDIRCGLIGAAHAGNASVAMAMLRAAGGAVTVSLHDAARVLPGVTLPGRFQRKGNFIFDVAHNPDGARVLAETLDAVAAERPVTAIVGVLSDKDWRQMIDVLAPHVNRFTFVAPPTAPASRAWDPADAHAYATGKGLDSAVGRDFSETITTAAGLPGTVVVTGSFHTVGDALHLLDMAPAT